MFALLVFIVPVIWLAIAKLTFKCKLTPLEMIIQFGAAAALSGILYLVGTSNQVRDHEIMTGHVVSKQQQRVSCSHSYQCMCVTHSDGNGGSYRVCQTCYEHTHDYDWVVNSTVGSTRIDRVDRRGSRTPPRWAGVQIGEPFHTTQSFTNYILGSPSSIFQRGVREYEGELPEYPRVYDYYRLNRVYGSAPGLSQQRINNHLTELLSKANVRDSLNVIIVLTEKSEETFRALEYEWLSGKNNDVVMVFGLDGSDVKWQESFTFGAGMGNRQLINELQMYAKGSEFTLELVTNMFNKAQEQFTKVDPEEFEYLSANIAPSTLFTIIAMLFNLGFAIFLTIQFSKGQLHFSDIVGKRRNYRY